MRELIPVQEQTENCRESGEKSKIDSPFLCRYLVWYFSDIYSD